MFKLFYKDYSGNVVIPTEKGINCSKEMFEQLKPTTQPGDNKIKYYYYDNEGIEEDKILRCKIDHLGKITSFEFKYWKASNRIEDIADYLITVKTEKTFQTPKIQLLEPHAQINWGNNYDTCFYAVLNENGLVSIMSYNEETWEWEFNRNNYEIH